MKQLTVAASILLGLILTLPICHAAQLQQLSYDANGNLISGDGFYREYDGYNRLVRVREGNAAGGTILEEQDWDLIEERVLARRTYTSGTLNKTVYYWTKDFVQVINASDGATTNETYVYLNDRLVGQRVNNDTTFIHSDHLGSSNVITSATGQVIERTIYEPYGKPITGAIQSRLDYTGKEQLPTASDYDYNFRRYNPNWGIFTQPDDRLPNIYDPQMLNRYAFVRSNPLSRIDKNGHDPITVSIIISVVIFAVAGAVVGAVYEVGSQMTLNDGKVTSWSDVGTFAVLGAVTSVAGVYGGPVAIFASALAIGYEIHKAEDPDEQTPPQSIPLQGAPAGLVSGCTGKNTCACNAPIVSTSEPKGTKTNSESKTDGSKGKVGSGKINANVNKPSQQPKGWKYSPYLGRKVPTF